MQTKNINRKQVADEQGSRFPTVHYNTIWHKAQQFRKNTKQKKTNIDLRTKDEHPDSRPLVPRDKVLYSRADKKHGLSDMAYSTVTLMLDGRTQIKIWTMKVS